MNYTMSGIEKLLESCYPHDLKECLIDLYALANGAKEQGLDVVDLAETMKHRIERLPFPSSIIKEGK